MSTENQHNDRFAALVQAMEPARAHFRESGRQAMLGSSLAMTAIADFLDSYNNDGLRHSASIILLARSVLDLLTAEITPLANADQARVSDAAKLEALFNLRSLVQAELERRETGNLDGATVLQSLLEGLQREIERIAMNSTAAEQTTDQSDTSPSGPYEVPIGA